MANYCCCIIDAFLPRSQLLKFISFFKENEGELHLNGIGAMVWKTLELDKDSKERVSEQLEDDYVNVRVNFNVRHSMGASFCNTEEIYESEKPHITLSEAFRLAKVYYAKGFGIETGVGFIESFSYDHDGPLDIKCSDYEGPDLDDVTDFGRYF